MTGSLSVIIPSRNEPYLKQTIDDILSKATQEIEVIAVLEGYWPTLDQLSKDPRVNYIHNTSPKGMRGAINQAVSVATSDFLLKTDAHCMFGKGFDAVLKADLDKNWISVPRRYPLDVSKWQIEERTDTKYPIDYMYLDENLQGQVWTEKNSDEVLKDLYIDDLMTSQGSCWMMHKDYFHELELLDDVNYGTFYHEMQEIGLKCWLSGGRMVVNKKTWYAHWHKTEGRGYSLGNTEKDKAISYVAKWKEDKVWHKQIHDLNWLFTKFNISI